MKWTDPPSWSKFIDRRTSRKWSWKNHHSFNFFFSWKAYRNHYHFVYENSFHRNIGGIFDHPNQSSLLEPLKIFNKYLINHNWLKLKQMVFNTFDEENIEEKHRLLVLFVTVFYQKCIGSKQAWPFVPSYN